MARYNGQVLYSSLTLGHSLQTDKLKRTDFLFLPLVSEKYNGRILYSYLLQEQVIWDRSSSPIHYIEDLRVALVGGRYKVLP
jgi:hypothetical protein